jgi:hypothetical protein
LLSALPAWGASPRDSSWNNDGSLFLETVQMGDPITINADDAVEVG